jgi:hypothetical protein
MTDPVRVGAFEIFALAGSPVGVEGSTVAGVASTGHGALYSVTDRHELHLTVRDTTWANGERDVVACERHDSPQRFDTLIERLRLGISPRDGDLYVELRHVRLKPNGRGNLFAPDEAMLDDGAGLSVRGELERFGATRVGSREELLGDTGRSRSRLGATFGRDAVLVPLVAYVLTRVAPTARRVTTG